MHEMKRWNQLTPVEGSDLKTIRQNHLGSLLNTVTCSIDLQNHKAQQASSLDNYDAQLSGTTSLKALLLQSVVYTQQHQYFLAAC